MSIASQSSAHFADLDEKEYKRRIRAWTMYDWANSAFVTTILAAVAPIYYSRVAGATLPSEAAATALWSMGLSISLFIAAILAPILGTISDVVRGKRKFLAIFIGMGVVATGLLVLVGTGDWILASILFILGRIGFNAANVFYDALLPHVAKEEDQDDVSSRGYAMGYLGGGLLLAINIVMIFVIPDFPGFEQAGTRLAMFSVAIWWAVFSIPVLTRIPEPPSAASILTAGQNVVAASFKQISTTFRDIKQYRELFKFLIAFLIYNDGIGTIIGVAAIYGAELGFGTIELILALLLVQMVGIPFALVFGKLPNPEAKGRPVFLTFVVLNMILLPAIAVGGRFFISNTVTGASPAPYLASGDAVGQGVYSIGGDSVQTKGDWQSVVIPAAELSGGPFVTLVNNIFGEPLTDVTYLETNSLGDALDFRFNGQQITLTYSIGPDHGTWDVLLDGSPLLDGDGNPVIIEANSPTPRYGESQTLDAGESGLYTVSVVNSGTNGAVMSVASLEVLEPVRENNLGLIIVLVFGANLLALGIAALIGRPIYAALNARFNLDAGLDTKRSVVLALIVYSEIAIWGFFLDSTIEFWFLAWMVAIVQGGSQALSRSLYSAMSPASKSGEFFGLFGVMEKFSSILGPILFAVAGTLLGSSRPAILSLILFFIVGIFLLLRVDVAEGKRVAHDEDAELINAVAS